jgi:hypothetical protein
MKFKILLLMLSIFLISGCSATYNLTITNKKEVIEEGIFLDNNDNILKYDSSVLEFLYRQEEVYTENYKTNIIEGENASGLVLNQKYKSINALAETEIPKYLFENISVKGDNELFIVKTTGDYLRTNAFAVDLSKEYLYNLDEIVVNIKFYNNVEVHNADKVDKKNNTYTWVLKKTDDYRTIEFNLKKSVRYDIMIKDVLNRNKGTIIVVIILIGLAIFGFIKMKQKVQKNNAI